MRTYQDGKRRCSNCKKLLEVNFDNFTRNKKMKDGFNSRCRKCALKFNRLAAAKNPEKYLEYNKKYRRQRFELIQKLKSEKGCCICKEPDPRCLDFHHVNGKSFTISDKICFSLEKLLLEIAKCEVICANFHRKHHRKLWYKGGC
jgi:hypothetical protein